MATKNNYVCGAPKSRNGGGRCQNPVARQDLRCHHHPKTVLEEEQYE